MLAPDYLLNSENKSGTSTAELRKLDIHEMLLIPNTVNRGGVFAMARQAGIAIKTKKYSETEVAVIRIA